jgi:hypothetical protein
MFSHFSLLISFNGSNKNRALVENVSLLYISTLKKIKIKIHSRQESAGDSILKLMVPFVGKKKCNLAEGRRPC